MTDARLVGRTSKSSWKSTVCDSPTGARTVTRTPKAARRNRRGTASGNATLSMLTDDAAHPIDPMDAVMVGRRAAWALWTEQAEPYLTIRVRGRLANG